MSQSGNFTLYQKPYPQSERPNGGIMSHNVIVSLGIMEAQLRGGGTFRCHRFGAGQLGAVPFRRRKFRRRFLIYFYFSSYEEKTMKQAIS